MCASIRRAWNANLRNGQPTDPSDRTAGNILGDVGFPAEPYWVRGAPLIDPARSNQSLDFVSRQTEHAPNRPLPRKSQSHRKSRDGGFRHDNAYSQAALPSALPSARNGFKMYGKTDVLSHEFGQVSPARSDCIHGFNRKKDGLVDARPSRE